MYRGRAPIFITTKADHIVAIERAAAWAQRTNQPSEHTMLLRRLKIFMLETPVPVPSGASIPECVSCFARMALHWTRDSRGVAAGAAAAPDIDPDDL